LRFLFLTANIVGHRAEGKPTSWKTRYKLEERYLLRFYAVESGTNWLMFQRNFSSFLKIHAVGSFKISEKFRILKYVT